MIQHNDNTPVTIGILNESLKEAMKTNREEIKKDTQEITREIMTEVLGEFTEEVLLPAVTTIVKDEIQKEIGLAKTELKDYVDKKNGELRGDIISVMKGDKDRDQTFKTKMTEIVARNKLARDDEVTLLYGLAR